MRPPYRARTACVFAVMSIAGACNSADSISSNERGRSSTISVSIAPKFDTLPVGATRQLAAQVLTDHGQTGDVKVDWRSADPTVASVSSLGNVAAVAPGTTRVIAMSGEKSDSATIVVVRSSPGLSISPNAMYVALGDSIRLTATPDAGSSAAGAGVEWSTSDPAVADVSPDGVVTTADSGAVTIFARLSGAVATADVRVAKAQPASLSIGPATSAIYKGQTQQLTATVSDASGRVISSTGVKWSTSSSLLATVSSTGLVTAIAKGMVIISAQLQSRKATAVVNVLDVPAANVAVSLKTAMLSVGQTTQASAVLKDAQGNILTGHTIAWQSSNPALATVNATGVVTGVAKGALTISAISDGTVGDSPLTVTTPTPTSIVVTPSTASITLGQNAQLVADERDANGGSIPNRPITWSSDNSSIASVSSSGVATANAIGSTVVHASADGLTADVAVTTTTVPVASVGLTPTSATVTMGDSTRLTATARDAAGAVLSGRDSRIDEAARRRRYLG